MKPIALTTHNFVLFLIIIVAGVIRVFGLEGFTYSADEISALTRTDFSSLSQLFEYGVMKRDMHPAGTQLFLYFWTQLFGYNEWIVRLPFVLPGIGSIFLSYKLAKKWFNPSAGLITAAFLAGLEYFILYSEIARPYSPGLFFVLLAACYWDKIVFDRGTKAGTYFFFIMSCVICLYTHYYAAVSIGVISLSGFLYIDNTKIKAYLLSGFFIALLFMPHYWITAYQMDTGGLHGWLGPPGKYWIFNYLFYLFNESWFLLTGLGVLLLISIYFKVRDITINKMHFLCLLWFSIIFLFGFFYSRSFSPILQYSVMLFAAPFLLMVLADMLSFNKEGNHYLLIPVLVLALACLSTITEKKFFSTTHFGVIEELSVQNLKWEERYGNIDRSVNVSAKGYLDFIHDLKDIHVNYDVYVIDVEEDWDSLYRSVRSSESDFYSYGWSTRSNSMLIHEMIKLKFPRIIENINYTNSQITLYSKEKGKLQKPIRTIEIDLSDRNHRYFTGNKQTITDHGRYGEVIHLTDDQPYALEIQIPITDLSLNPDEYIAVNFEFLVSNKSGFFFVYQIDRDGQLLKQTNGEDAWFGRNSQVFIEGKDWQKFVHARKVDEFLEKGDIAKMFFWNPNGSDFYIRNIKISVFKNLFED